MKQFLLVFLLCPVFLTAQSDFLKDPDIVWAVEIEQDWVVDIPSLEAEWDEGITTIKLLRTTKNEQYWSSPYLADLVFQAALDHKLPIFKDAHCLIPADPFQVYPDKDTLITFDPETYEEKKQVGYYEPSPFGDFRAWRLRQILAYHQKSASWSTTVEAIAPMVAKRNTYGELDTTLIYPLFWFKPENKRPKLTSGSVVWAKQTMNKTPKTRLKTDQPNLVKLIDGFQFPVEHFLKVVASDKNVPFYGTINETPLSMKDRRALVAQTDTVVTFDPETYEEKVQIIQNEINPSDISQLRLVQTWYWDERRAKLAICLDAVGLMKDVLDSHGNFRFSIPLVYRRVKS